MHLLKYMPKVPETSDRPLDLAPEGIEYMPSMSTAYRGQDL